MRYLVVGLVLASAAGSVHADPLPESSYDYKKPNSSGVFIDFGGGWQRIHPNGFTYRTEYLRIAPAVSINHFLYVGAAVQLGNVYSAYGAPDYSSAANIAANMFMDEGSGSSLGGQIFIGARQLIGIVSFGGEIAPTYRSTSAGLNYDYATDKTSTTTLALHARGDVWLMPYVSAGVMVGMDVASIRDFMGGIQIGFHVEPYDAMKR